MRLLTFSKRCAKEILRDPINLLFGLGFPLILLILLSAMQKNIPVGLFKIEILAPGIAVFGLSFITLFSATLVSRDRESAFLTRLYTTPLASSDFIFGYLLPLIPLAAMQAAATFILATILGLKISLFTLIAIIAILPISIFYIALGLLFGSILGVKQVGGICGALLTNLSAWLSGIWFDLSLLGAGFEKFANFLPFVHSVEFMRAIISGDLASALAHILPILCYTAVILLGAIMLFLRQMRRS